MDVPTIIVISGMAGMSCASRLDAYNKPFTRISDRLGGRIFSTTSSVGRIAGPVCDV